MERREKTPRFPGAEAAPIPRSLWADPSGAEDCEPEITSAAGWNPSQSWFLNLRSCRRST